MTEGILHAYHPSRNLNLFEHRPRPPTNLNLEIPSPVPPPKHVLLFIGGLYDTFLKPEYVTDLSQLFPLHVTQAWRVMHVQLSSAGRQWGTSDLDKDIEEIGVCVEYIRKDLFKKADLDVVLMGHSTGCQDIMRYLTASNPVKPGKPARPVVQGGILQASVSDRDALLHSIDEGLEASKAIEKIMKIVEETPESEHRDTVIPLNLIRPLFGVVPVSIARFLSLSSPGSPEKPSAEDFFSSDLSDKTLKGTFGAIGKNRMLNRSTGDGPRDTQSILIVMSDSDEHVRPKVSQKVLLKRWREAMTEDTGAEIHGDSAVILNALHDVGGNDWPSREARLVVLRKKVLHYLRFVVAGGVDRYADEIWHADGDRVMAMKVGDGRSVEDMVGVLKL